MADVVSIQSYRPARVGAGARVGRNKVTVFNRRELDLILQLYGRNVVAGRWRDYTLDFTPVYACFAVIRGAGHEGPAYRILKTSHRGGPYAVVAGDGRVVRRGEDLHALLKYFEEKPRAV